MKTNMLIFSLMISAAAAAQTSVQANSSSKSDLTVKKSQVTVAHQGSGSLETSSKNNKISGETSLQQQAKLTAGKQGESARLAQNGVRTTEKLSGSAQNNSKATVKASKAAKASVQKSAKTTVSQAHAATVKNAGAVKMAVKPHPIKVNTQIKTVAAVKVI